MFTTGDMLAWNKLPDSTRDLARRYFLMYPETLRHTDAERRASVEPSLTEGGVKFADLRSSRPSPEGHAT